MAMISCKECGTQISSKAKACPKCGAKPPASGAAWIISIFILIVVFIAITDNKKSTNSAASSNETSLSDLSFNYELEKAGFGSVILIKGSIKNNGTTGIKDLKIECVGRAPSGTATDTNHRTLYEAVSPGETHPFSNLNMGFINSQATTFGCSILGFSKQ